MVISIISLLSSVVLASIKDARQKAQINAFVVQMKQVQIALESYRNDYGKYPDPVSSFTLNTYIQENLSQYIQPIQYPSFINSETTEIYIPGSSIWRCNTSGTSTTYIIKIVKPGGVSLPYNTVTSNTGGVISGGNYYCLTF